MSDIVGQCQNCGDSLTTDHDCRATAEIAAQCSQREVIAEFMHSLSIATGHGDTSQDLLSELGAYISELRKQVATLARERDALQCLARDVYAALGPRDNPTGDLDDDVRNIVQAHTSCRLVEAELSELRDQISTLEQALEAHTAQNYRDTAVVCGGLTRERDRAEKAEQVNKELLDALTAIGAVLAKQTERQTTEIDRLQPMPVGPCQMCGEYGTDCCCGQGEPTGTDDDLISRPVVDAFRKHLQSEPSIPGLPAGMRIKRIYAGRGTGIMCELEPIAPAAEKES